MTFILDRLNSDDDSGRIEQLETELERVGKAFEDYIATTEGLETDVKNELDEMQAKLHYSTKANEELVEKIHTMEALFKNLELSSEGIRNKLKVESELRRKAEQALTETEMELRSKNVRIRQLEQRNDSSALRIVDSGIITEMANNTSKAFTDRDLEAVTNELIMTQEKLAMAEEQLMRSQTLVQDLERNLQNLDNSVASLSGDDKELLRELEDIRAEIDAARSDDSQSRSTVSEQSKDYRTQLEDSREENTELKEEIACLRNILYEHGESKEAMKSEVSIRKKMEEKVNENMALQEKIRKLQIIGASQGVDFGHEIDLTTDELAVVPRLSEAQMKLSETQMMLKKSQEECAEMRTEILSLTESLYEANQRRGKGSFDFNGLQRQDNELLLARNEIVDKNREISTLETSLMTAQQDVQALTKELSGMSSAFEKVRDVNNAVFKELEETKSALAAVKDSKSKQQSKLKRLELSAEKAPEKDAELKVLRSQLKKLCERNESLTQQVKDLTREFESMSGKHEKVYAESTARMARAKELENDIAQVVSETRQRNREAEDLTVQMENRMGMAEKNIEALDSEIVVAMKKLESAEASASGRKEDPPMIVVPAQSESETILTEDKEEEDENEDQQQEEEEQGEQEEKDNSSSSRLSVLERTRRLLEFAGSVQKLAIKSISLRETRSTVEDEPSKPNTSLHSKKHNKYDELIKKVADYESQVSNEIREVEAGVDDVVTDIRE